MNVKTELEFLELLRKTCRTSRTSKARPDLAIPAAEWEIKINTRIDELGRLETPELELAGNHHHKQAA